MNKIFKVVWSKVRNCYVVVSEIAKNTVSGVGKRNRIGKVSLAATLAASVLLTGGFFMPNEVWAAGSQIVSSNPAYYAAIGDAVQNSSPFSNGNGFSYNFVSGSDGKRIKVTIGSGTAARVYYYDFTPVTYQEEKKDSAGNVLKDNDGNIIYETKTKNYWIREGFGVKGITERYHTDALNIKLDLYIKDGTANYNDIVTAGQHAAAITDEETVINKINLDELAYIQYAAITNTSTTGVDSSHHFYIKQGEALEDIPYQDIGNNTDDLDDNFYVFNNNEFNDETGKYVFNGKDVEYENVYNITGKGIGVFLTKSVRINTGDDSADVARKGAEVYGGSVYGKNNEVLLSGYNNKTGKWSTVWAAEVTDPNATIQSMTLDEFNEILHHIHEEDVKLNNEGLVKAKVTSLKDTKVNTDVNDDVDVTTGGSINFINKLGNQVPGLLVQSVAETGKDTKITFTDTGEIDENGELVNRNVLELNAGSRVEANVTADANKGPLTKLSINGEVYSVATSDAVEASKTEVRKADEEIDNTDNQTQPTVLSVTDVSPNNAAHKTYEINVADMHVSNVQVANGDNGELNGTVTMQDGVTANIDGLHDYYTSDVSVTANGNTANVQFNRNDGNNKYNFNIVGGSNVSVTSGTDGKSITISADDYRLVEGTSTIQLENSATKTGYVVGTDGTVDLKVQNGNDVAHAQTVTIGNVASKAKLDEVTGKVNAGWNLKVEDESTGYNVKPEDGKNTVTLESNDANLTIDRIGGVVTFGFSENPNFTSVNVGSGSKVVISDAGINMNNRNIVGLAKGVDNNHAANVGQLPVVNSGSNDIFVSPNTNGDTGKTTYSVSFTGKYVNDASYDSNNKILSLKLNDGTELLNADLSGIVSGLSSTDHRLVKNTQANSNGEYRVGSTGEIELIVANRNGQTDANSNVRITGIASKETLDDVASKVASGWKLAVNDDTDSYNVKPEGGKDSVRLKATNGNDSTSNNLTISRDGEIVTFNFSDTPSFTSVSVGGVVNINNSGVTIENGTNDIILSKNNISVGGNQIHNVAAGTADNDAVNVKQLKDARTQVVDGKNTTVTSVTDNSTNQVTYTVNAEKTTVSTTDSNLKITKNENTDTLVTDYDIDLKDNITLGSDVSKQVNIDGVLGKVKVGNVVEVSTDGIAMGGAKITGLAAGENPNDAVNMSQLNAVSATVNKGWNLNVSGSASYKVVPDGNVTLKSANGNLQIANANGVVTFTAKDDFIGTAGFNIDTGTLTLGYDGNGRTALAVTGLMNSWTAQVDSEILTVGNKDVVSYIAGNNIDLTIAEDTTNGGGSITVATDNVVTFDSVTVNGSTTGNNVVINSSGINAGGYDITNVGAGEISDISKDAVNGGQLWSAQQQDIKEITITQSGSNGYDTINLMRENGTTVLGSLKFTSGGGDYTITGTSNGIDIVDSHDTFVQISNDGGNIVLNTGSVVRGNYDGVSSKTYALHNIYVNGVTYTLPSFNEFSKSFTDYHLSNGSITLGNYKNESTNVVTSNITGYKVNADGIVQMEVLDNHEQDGSHFHGHVYIGNIATKTQQDTNTAQLKGTVMYDYDTSTGKYDYNSIVLGETGSNINGTPTANYQSNGNSKPTGGVKVTNVAYAVADKTDTTNYDGSAAVNVDLLNDKISEAVVEANQTAETKDKYLIANPETNSGGAYTVKENKVTLKVANSTDVVINDVASATDLGKVADLHSSLKNNNPNETTSVVYAVNKLDDKVGDINNYSSNQYVVDGESLAVSVGKLDAAIKNASATAGKHSSVSNSDGNIVIDNSGENANGGVDYRVSLSKDVNVKETLTVGTINDKQIAVNGNEGTIKVGTVNVSATGNVTGLTNVSWDEANISSGQAATEDQVQVATKNVVRYDNDTKDKVTFAGNGDGTTLTNVAKGKISETSKDAVNGSQLFATNQVVMNNYENIQNLSAQNQQLDSRINQVNSRVNKVGAGAAALAALHPMDFDPDDKLSFAVGAGNYAGENATALGAFYRPNEKVMMNVAGTYGNGENMVNVGMSFALDRTNNVSNSRTAMAKEIVDLREQVATQGQQIAQLVALVQQLAGTTQPIVPAEQLFPDVPQNHWAYEYVNGLIAKGIIEGYPDGTFGGDRAMTRYEFAAMLFRAMEQGVVINEQVRQEFEKELGRIRVDRVKGADADLNKIERVRVNTAIDRDDYGSKVVQVKH